MNDLDELLAIIAQRYGLSLGQARQLDGGDECLVWSVPSHQGPLVVQSSPCWSSPERLAWTHRLMLSLQAVLPQVIAPLRALDGSTLFRYNDRSVALFPYVAGAPFDRENPKLRQEAATFLARLHATLLNRAPDSAGLPRHLLIGAPPLPPAPDPDSLIDLELDTWRTTLLQKSASFSTGLIHGDYYRRNLLTQEEQIIALLDFDDLHLDFLMQEVPGQVGSSAKPRLPMTGISIGSRRFSGAIERQVVPANRKNIAPSFPLSGGDCARNCAVTSQWWLMVCLANLSMLLGNCALLSGLRDCNVSFA